MRLRPRIDLSEWHTPGRLTLAAVTLIVVSSPGARLHAQTTGEPYATLLPATTITFPNDTDSNSPAVWEIVDGTWTLSFFSDHVIVFGRR